LAIALAIICEHLSLNGASWVKPITRLARVKTEDRYQLSEDTAMGEFLTVDILADGIAIVGALGFFFLGYQALQMLKK